MSNAKNKAKILKLTQLGVLTAILVVMAFTPLGYLKIGPTLSISFLTLPVLIGAIVIGPVGGAILGGVFGLTSFIQCFGMDVFGTSLANINVIYAFIMCMIPRILCGLLSGLIYKGLVKVDKTKIVSVAVASVSCAIINTLLFVGAMILFYMDTEPVKQIGSSVLAIFGALITVNSAIEACVCLVIGTALSKILLKFSKKPTQAVETA